MENEPAIRLAVSLGTLALLTLAELAAPRRRRVVEGIGRRVNNALLLVCGSLVVRLLPVLSAVGAAAWAQGRGVGLLNTVDAPLWVDLVVTVVLFDLLVYGQHVVSHLVPALWRFHKVHHADLDLDATSALRFHPVEIALSAGLKAIVAVLLGAPPEGVVLFEVVLNATALFNHANLALPGWLDAALRRVVVTPDMHRVHHSVRRAESNTNFGFSLPWWDWLFGTYLPQPKGDHRDLELGLAGVRDPDQSGSLARMLMMPFRDTEDRSPPTHSGQDRP